jgi:putative Holliday junction resolvase
MNNHYLGLDYGEKHIGVAIAKTFVADPYQTIRTTDALELLGKLITEHQITHIIMGLSENIIGEKTKAFADQLTAAFHLPIIFHDETLTSYETRTELAKLGARKKIREAKIDHYVAAAILQDYLDSI